MRVYTVYIKWAPGRERIHDDPSHHPAAPSPVQRPWPHTQLISTLECPQQAHRDLPPSVPAVVKTQLRANHDILIIIISY